MSLSAYKQKRSFKVTPEPKGGRAEKDILRFVVQKHDATRLHYDFRLEMGGVLKSWAVPKGPSLDPEHKRLAMMVEDHPYDYRTFEGIIPKGEYGGGTVIVWDEGYFEPIEKIEGKKAQEKYLLKELKSGSVKVVLHGKKLKGEFALVKTKGMGENAWLLIKHRDRYASETDILKKDKSVLTKKTIAQMEKTAQKVWDHGKETPIEKLEEKIEDKPKAKSKSRPKPKITGNKQRFYTKVNPMLSTLVEKPVPGDDWLYEIKWDGYRAVAFMNNDKIELKSRNDKSFNEKFYPVYNALKDWNINAVVDGEVVVVDEKGLSNFGALQNWRSDADGDLLYYVFDILWYDGHDLKELKLTERRAILEKLIPKNSLIQFSKNFETDGEAFLKASSKIGLEGIMAKKKDSIYETNQRTRNWLKIKSNKRQEVVIGGYTKNKGSDKPFSSLLVGVYEGKKYKYIGKTGTGFSIEKQKELLKQFKSLEVKESQFDELPDVNKPNRFRPNPLNAEATWLKPKLVCEVSFTEMTSDGLMRHPSFEGMREDKKANKVVLEEAEKIEKIDKETSKYVSKPKTSYQKLFLNPTEKTQVKKVQGHELKFTNLNKLYWKKEKISKRDLINYYEQMSSYILPYLKNRPQSLNRHPNGIDGQSFYQKDVTGKVPGWTDKYLYHTDDSDADKHFLLGNNKATLLYMASLGCIEINPWSSATKKPDHPTWCILDLDPDKTTFKQVIETAQVAKAICDDLGIDSYCKTSGSTGLHIYIPLGAKYTYEQSKEFARILVTLIHRELPKITTLERTISARKGKMYLDFLQNRAQATIASPYSVRPKPGATVSAPLHWDEVKPELKMTDFTIHNMFDRVKDVGDIFKPVLGKGIDLKKVLEKAKTSP